MLKFTALSLAQKRFVVEMLENFPELKNEKTIDRAKLHEVYFAMADKRGETGLKLGYPNWLVAKNAVGRGLYEIPQPTDFDLSQYAKDLSQKQAAKAPKAPKVKVAKVAAAKAKVAKLAAKKVAPVVTNDEDAEIEITGSRLNRIIEESSTDQDYEDFNQILRDNGIEV